MPNYFLVITIGGKFYFKLGFRGLESINRFLLFIDLHARKNGDTLAQWVE
jgi:hypothetical protein